MPLQSDKTKVPKTLLLADDSVTIQRVIELTFADEDIKVVAVSDGDQAIERIEAAPPDIVLVDIGMPGRSGYEVARHIKRSPRLQHIPVLLLTGAFEPVDQKRAAAAGCDGVLAKPFEPQLVIARVKELLGRDGRGTPPAEAAAENPLSQAAVVDLRAPAPAQPVVDLWAPAADEPVADPPRPAQVAHLDNYFAQLDAAFTTLESAPAERAKEAKTDSTLSPLADSSDWFKTTLDASPVPSPVPPPVPPPDLPPDLPLSTVAPARQAEPAPQPAPVAPPMPAPEVQAEPGALPSLSDAFAAILAAEQHEPMPALPPLWPMLLTPPTPPTLSANAAPSLGEDAIEEITRRVLDRLSDRIVRETVADLVSHIAERLVRDEIERIKAASE